MDTATASALPQVAFEDGLGQRRQIVGAGNQPMTILVLDHELTSLPSFEAALRERIDQLAGFHHPTFARVRGIAHLARVPSSLALASDHVSGARLSELLEVAEQSLIPLEIEGAYCLIRQLVPAIAALHERQPYGCHGALAPERLIVTPGGHLVIVEHVLATALDHLRFSHERYWKQFRIALPTGGAAPHFDRRADVVQIGTLALALILGRPLRDNEFPGRIQELVGSVRAISATGLELLPEGLHSWLKRTLQLEGDKSFATAIEASAELDRVIPGDDAKHRRALEAFLAQCYAALPEDGAKSASPIAAPQTAIQTDHASTSTIAAPPVAIHTVADPNPAASPFMQTRSLSEDRDVPPRLNAPAAQKTPAVAAPAPSPVAGSGLLAGVTPPLVEREPSQPIVPVASAPKPVVQAAMPSIVQTPVMPLSTPGPTSVSTTPVSLTPVPTTPVAKAPAPAAPLSTPPFSTFMPERTAVALTSASRHLDEDIAADETWEPSEDGVENRTGWGRNRLIAAAVALIAVASAVTLGAGRYLGSDETGTLVVNTNPAGVSVVIDGQRHGATPVTLQLTPGEHVLTLASGSQSRTIPVTITQGSQMSQFIEFPAVVPAAVDGKLQVRTDPPGASVAVDGQPRGNSPLLVEGLAPGVHAVRLENAMGSVTEQVTIEAGTTASLVVPLAAQAGAPVSGWISIAAPVDVQVYEDQRLIGSSRTERIMMPVGRHELEIVNEPLGYRATRVVQVTPGATAAVRLDWPKGSIALNAQPWAEVWLDGQRLGETPIGNVQVPIGTHQVLFRHPELGEQTHTVTVTAERPARVSADLRTR